MLLMSNDTYKNQDINDTIFNGTRYMEWSFSKAVTND